MTRIDLTDILICIFAWAMFCLMGCAPAEPFELGEAQSPGMGQGATWNGSAPPGAAPVVQRGIWIEPGLPVLATEQACAMWGALGADCSIAEFQEAAWLQIHDGHEADCVPDEANHVVWLGSGSWQSVSIRFVCFLGLVEKDTGITQYYIRALAHEIGHGFGLQHVADDTALMYWSTNPQRDHITDSDRAEFARVWGQSTPP